MNPYDFYISPSDYERAAAAGVSKKTLELRIRKYGWKKERAITEPPKKSMCRKAWVEIAKQNGISYGTFMGRVNQYGWDEERSATTPLQDIRAMVAVNRKRSIPEELIQRAEQNGIGYRTLYARINRHGWEPEEAATRRTLTRQEIGLLGRKAYESKYGRRSQGEPKMLL